MPALAEQVVRSGNCSGCGLCTQLDRRLTMQLDAEGFARPVFRAGPEPSELERRTSAREFKRACPGRRVHSPATERAAAKNATAYRHLGGAVSVWQGHAVDPALRYAGSSGGVLTALQSWLLSAHKVERVATVAVSPSQPSRSEPVTLTTSEAASGVGGSRYAPSPALANPDTQTPGTAIVAKPCEVAAMKQLAECRNERPPILLTFFCAGVPSQHATDELVASVNVNPERLVSMRYRGEGWPGSFAARDADGNAGSRSYDDSWGAVLGKQTQWRCKFCVDGVGESGDIAVGDFWESDERGYPVFDEGEGTSVVIARTPRGHELLLEAFRDGVLNLRPADLGAVMPVQPLQVDRRRTLAGRLLGVRLAGRRTPGYRGYSLLALAWRYPYPNLRAMPGALKRAIAGRRAGGRT